jgi:oxygen-independent coproporphyrinogen-3 oxidase
MEMAEKYVQALIREIENSSHCTEGNHEVDSIYFGGGTPSLLSPAHIHQILQVCSRRFVLSRNCEISLEGNPGTFSSQSASALRDIGINRVSIGAQSFDNRELASVGRLHGSSAIPATLSNLSRNGFENLSIDLMLGLPYQTRESWRKGLSRIDTLPVSHISVYMLDLDEECPLQKQVAGGLVHLPSEDVISDLYLETLEALEAMGFHQYEISNFARRGFSCRHNLKYWKRQPVLGFGLGSHSFDGRSRYANHSRMTEYLGAIAIGKSPVRWQETPTHEQAMGETLFLGLRLNEGVDWNALHETYNHDCLAMFKKCLDGPADRGWVEWHGSTVRLTSSGMLLSNEVFQLFL